MRTRTYSTVIPNITIGIDLGDRSRVYVVDGEGERVEERWMPMTREAWERWLAKYPGARVAMEAGTHSPWVSRLAEARGHEVIVANPSELYGRKRRKRRNDKLDAEKLARLARVDPALLYPIWHRGEEAQADLAVLQSRDTLVKVRATLVSHARGLVKALGERLPRCSTDAFARQVRERLPDALRPALGPVVAQIEALTAQIRSYDKLLEKEIAARYPEIQRLQQIQGVGPITSLGYVLVLEDPAHFPRPREVGSFVGLVPRLDESGGSSPQLGITKAGHKLLRSYLVEAGHYILGPFGPDTDLRRWGLHLTERGGKNAKKRAAVAVARKLSVVLHRLWATGAEYVPLRAPEEAPVQRIA